MRLVSPPEQPAECEPILRLPRRARPRLHTTMETAMIPDPKDDPAEPVEEVEKLDENGQPKWGGGGRDHKPGKPQKPQPQWGGGGREAPAPKPEDAA
jgi:hypothetical protein